MAAAARGRQHVVTLWLILLLLVATTNKNNSNGQAQAAPAAAAATKTATGTAIATATQQLQIGVEGDMPKLMVATRQQHQQLQHSSTTTATATTTTTVAAPATVAAVNKTSMLSSEPRNTAMPVKQVQTTTAATFTAEPSTTKPTATTGSDNSNTLNLTHMPQRLEAVVQLLDLEGSAAPPAVSNGHDGLKLTKKKQLKQQQYSATTDAASVKTTAKTTTTAPTITTTNTAATNVIETTTSSTSSSLDNSHQTELLPVPNGYLGPIFMGEKTFSVVHPLKKPVAPNDRQHSPEDSIELQLRQGRIVEILAPTALLELNLETSSLRPGTTTRTTTLLPAAPQPHSVLSTTVFQVPEHQISTTRQPMAAAEISVAGSLVQLAAPPRTESKISDIQIEVYDSTVDSIVASTNFRDNQGFYPMPLEPAAVGPTKPPSSAAVQERFTQYVIDRSDVSTQPAAAGNGIGKPEPAAIEIHINVSEAFGNESEDLEFSYRQPPASDRKSNKPNDEILVVEIIDNSAGDNNTDNSFSSSAEHMNLNPMFSYPYRSSSDAQAPAVRPPQDAADELFMVDSKGGLPRPPLPPPPPPMPRKPTIDRDSDTIFYISNTEVKVGESLPTTSSGMSNEQLRKLQFENQFFPASYMLEQQQLQQQQQQEDIILSPMHHSADAMKILRPGSNNDPAPPLDVTYVGESVIEVEQQSASSSGSSTQSPMASSPQPDIIIQPAVLPDLAIGVPVIGELPPQIELKEIDYMPGELVGQGRNIYENDIDGNGLGPGNDPDVLESSIQYGGDLIDDGAGGGFDGVEGSYPFESPAHRQQQQDLQHDDHQQQQHGLYRQTLNHGAYHLHREQLPVAELLNATLQQLNESFRASGINSGDTSAMAPLLRNQLPERMGNATALSEDPLADYDGYLNIFAVAMGLIIVILPAALLTSMYCAVRYLLNKNANSSAAGDDSEQCQGQDSKNESSSCYSTSPSSQLSNPCANLTSNPSPSPNAALIRTMSLDLASGVQRIEFQFEGRPDIQTPSSIGAAKPTFGGGAFAFSGCVTKMTLKDNHLVVVTEQRYDISRSARETKMHTDKNGVFVVEVSRGIDSKQLPDSPATGNDITELPFDTSNSNGGKQAASQERTLPPGHEQVQIHAPPSDFANPLPLGTVVTVGTVGSVAAVGLQLIEEEQLLPEEEPALPIKSQTGLSQSDLSSTSSGDSNKRYSYGNQELYVIEQPGYAGNSPLVLHSQLIAGKETTADKKQEVLVEEPPLPAPAAFGNVNKTEFKVESLVEETGIDREGEQKEQEKQKEEQSKQEMEVMQLEPENNYDSLMSLPAPPSTEEIKELNDFTLIETNQLDSLPPPPPPPPLIESQNDKQEEEEQNEENQKTQIDPKTPALKPTNGNMTVKMNGNIAKTNNNLIHPPLGGNIAGITNGNGGGIGGGEEPSTLTPPASPPTSPVASGASSLCAASLSNGGIHAVAVNGS